MSDAIFGLLALTMGYAAVEMILMLGLHPLGMRLGRRGLRVRLPDGECLPFESGTEVGIVARQVGPGHWLFRPVQGNESGMRIGRFGPIAPSLGELRRDGGQATVTIRVSWGMLPCAAAWLASAPFQQGTDRILALAFAPVATWWSWWLMRGEADELLRAARWTDRVAAPDTASPASSV